MNARKIWVYCLLSNLLIGSVLFGVLTFTQTAQAKPEAAAALVGPFYYTLSSMDFNTADDVTWSFGRSGLALYRTSDADPSVATAPVHLPGGANIKEIYLDASDNDGNSSLTVRLQSCPLTTSGCSNAPSGAVITTDNSGRQQKTAAFDFTVNNQTDALFVQAEYGGTRTPNVALYFVRLAYYLPAPAFLPLIQR